MNILQKLANEKFDGDYLTMWKYVLYECSPEERDMYIKHASIEQLNIAMSALKKKEDNELYQLAKQKFNDDMQATWAYIFSQCSEEEIERYTSMADTYQAGQAFLLVNNGKMKNQLNNEMSQLKDEKNLSSLNISREEVLNAKKNPYKSEIMKNLFKILLTSSSIVALSALGGPALGISASGLTAIESVLGILNSTFAFDLADKLTKYFKFKKAKETISKENNLVNDSVERRM